MTENNKTFNDCPYNPKYDQMGVTPKELYYRQNKLCHPINIYDNIDNKIIFGDVYCTDGKECALTKRMLNPTFECAECLTNFIRRILEDAEMVKKLNTKIINIIMFITELKTVSNNVVLQMNKNTFEYLEAFLNEATIFSDRTNPLKVTASGDILMFGAAIKFKNDLEDGLIISETGEYSLRV